MIIKGNAIDLIETLDRKPDLVVTDPPYAFGGDGAEHELSASVAVALRGAAEKLKRDSWMIVMCASSSRSIEYMKESLRGVAKLSRVATWVKPKSRTKVTTSGWSWASVSVLLFKKGKPKAPASAMLDYIMAEPLKVGRRAQLPPQVADWMVGPWAKPGGLLLDPFAGSGAILDAGKRAGMEVIGFEINPPEKETA